MKRIIEDLIEKRKAKQEKLEKTLGELAGTVGKRPFFRRGKGKIEEKLAEFGADLAAFITAQDREWDAYAGNHSTMVFKSLQWKIEKLENEYSNLRTLLTRFVHLERTLDRLLDKIEKRGNGRRSRKSGRSRTACRLSSTPALRIVSAATRRP